LIVMYLERGQRGFYWTTFHVDLECGDVNNLRMGDDRRQSESTLCIGASILISLSSGCDDVSNLWIGNEFGFDCVWFGQRMQRGLYCYTFYHNLASGVRGVDMFTIYCLVFSNSERQLDSTICTKTLIWGWFGSLLRTMTTSSWNWHNWPFGLWDRFILGLTIGRFEPTRLLSVGSS
jgi:hypothetical protein